MPLCLGNPIPFVRKRYFFNQRITHTRARVKIFRQILKEMLEKTSIGALDSALLLEITIASSSSSSSSSSSTVLVGQNSKSLAQSETITATV